MIRPPPEGGQGDCRRPVDGERKRPGATSRSSHSASSPAPGRAYSFRWRSAASAASGTTRFVWSRTGRVPASRAGPSTRSRWTPLVPLLAGRRLARRAGVIRTRAGSRRATALLLRLRYHLLTAAPDQNIPADVSRPHIERILADLRALDGHLETLARRGGEELLEAHHRVRKALRLTGVNQRIDPKLPVDILGVYVYLPAE